MAWIANLSDGSTLIEGKGLAGERSPWQQLLQMCRDKDLQISGLRLAVNNVTVTALPPKMCDGYFQAYEAMRIMFRDQIKHRQGIGSVIGDQVYIIWVDLNQEANNMNYVYSEVRPLSEVKIHTTID